MKSYLVDTHVLVWVAAKASRLSHRVRTIIEDQEATIYTSPVSAYEIINKHRVGKLHSVDPIIAGYTSFVCSLGFHTLDITLGDSVTAASFDAAHADPWDRLLAAQAVSHDFPLLSIDKQLDLFPIRRIW